MKFEVSRERAKSEGKGEKMLKLHVRISENSEISENYEIFSKASAGEW